MKNEIRNTAGGPDPALAKPLNFAAGFCALAIVLVMLTFASAAWAQGVNLQSGDIVVVTPLAGPCTGGPSGTCSYSGTSAVIQIKPSGVQGGAITWNMPNAQYPNGLLQQSVGVVADPTDSNLLVTDRLTGLIRVNPFDGTQTLLSSGGLFQDPFALTLGGGGQIYVADSGLRTGIGAPVNVAGRIILVNRTSGAQSVVTTLGPTSHTYGVAYDPIMTNMLYVSVFDSAAGTGSIIQVNPSNGSQTLIWGTAAQCAASGNSNCAVQQFPVACPMGLAVEATGNVIATAFNVPPYGCGNPGIIRVHLDTLPYSQQNLSVSPPVGWRIPFGIATEADQSILVVDEGYAALYHLSAVDGSFISPTPLSQYGLLGADGSGPTDLSVVKFTPTVHTGTGGGNPTTPTITWATPAAITYGTALSSTQLNATASVAGTFVYNPAAGTVPGAGSPTLSVTFTPTDTTNFTTATATVTLTVNKATPTITWANPAAITYGTALSSTQLNATSSVAGTFAYNPTAGTVLGAGPRTLSVTFTPTDTTDYTTATATMPLTVNKATPTITWANPAAINYGTTLSSTQLNATSSVAGTFVYTPAAGTLLAAGSQTLSVAFTPTDTADYNTATASVTLLVNQNLAVTISGSPVTIGEGTAITLTGTVTPAGAYTYAWTVTKTKNASSSTFATGTASSLTFTPNDDGTYAVSLTVTGSGGTGTTVNLNPSITVTNVAPAITSVTGPAAPLAVPATVSITAKFTDPGVLDTHTCTFNWNDGTTSTGGVTETNGSGSCTLSHTFTTADVYTITVTVADHDGGSTPGYYKYVVVYNPVGGWVSGIGQFTSPAGSYPANPLITATSNFGFIVGYVKGSTAPLGISEFQFKLATLKLLSTSYQYLVINGGTAQFKGTGTVKLKVPTHPLDGVYECDDNHYHSDCDDDTKFQVVSGNYNFIVTAVDGSATGGMIDRYRIKITDATGKVVYDNLMGAGDDPGTFTAPAIKNGRVVVHAAN